MHDKEIMFFLHSLNGIGRKTVGKLLEHFKSTEAIYHAPECELKQLLQPAQLRTFMTERERKVPREELRKLEKQGIHYYCIFDDKHLIRILQEYFYV